MADKTLLDSIEEMTDDELQKVRDKLTREVERRIEGGISIKLTGGCMGKSNVMNRLVADSEEGPLW